MKATIYSLPDEIEEPPCPFENRTNYQKLETAWYEKAKQWCIKRNPSKYVGEIIKFQVADGYAEYMVASVTHKVELIHLPTMDAYQSNEVYLMHGKDIIFKIEQQKSFERMLEKHRANK